MKSDNHDIRMPPQNLDAEKSVIGCQLLTGKFGSHTATAKIDSLPDVMSIKDFHCPANTIIQRAINRVREKKDGDCDVLLVGDELLAMGELANVGGSDYLIECLEAVPSSDHVLHYAEMVAACARRRKAIEIGEAMIRKAFDPTQSDQEFIENAHEATMKMAEMLMVRKSRPRLLEQHVEDLVEMTKRGEDPKMHWGIRLITEALGGVSLGSLIVVGGISGHGKSCFALQWLQESAKDYNVPSLFVSEEMPESEIAARALNYCSVIPRNEWISRIDELEQHSKDHFRDRAGILIAYNCGTIRSVEKTIERAIHSHKIRMVAVDFAQMIDGIGQTKEQQVGSVSKAMKKIAGKYQIIVLLLSQLNRDVEKRDPPVPKKSDLKDSSQLEQDADIVLMPYSPVKFNQGHSNPFEYCIKIAKHRDGGAEGKIIEMRSEFARQRIVPIDSLNDGRVYTQSDVDRFF